jgi:hypothetical protein
VAGIDPLRRIGRLGRRVLAVHTPPPRSGGMRLARVVASRHRPPLLQAATRLARANRRGPEAARPGPRSAPVGDPHLSDFAMEWMFGDGDLTDFAVQGLPEVEGPPSFLPPRPEPAAEATRREPGRPFEEFGPFRLSRVPAPPPAEAPAAPPEDGDGPRAEEEPAVSEPAPPPEEPDLSAPPEEPAPMPAGQEEARVQRAPSTPPAAPQPLSIRRVERPRARPARPVVARRPRPEVPVPEPTGEQRPETPSRPLLARLVDRVLRRPPSPPTSEEPVRAETPEAPALEPARVLARRAHTPAEPVAERGRVDEEEGRVARVSAPQPTEPAPAEPEHEPEPEPESERAADSPTAADPETLSLPKVVLQRSERTEPADTPHRPVVHAAHSRGVSRREPAPPGSQPLRALRRVAATVARLPRAVRAPAPPSPPATVEDAGAAREPPAVTVAEPEPARDGQRPQPVRLRSVARKATAGVDREQHADHFVQRSTALSLAAATGGTLARETAELSSVSFAPPAQPLFAEPAREAVLAREPDAAAPAAPAPAAAPAPEAHEPHAGHAPDVDYDDIYDHVLRRLRRDLLREREQMGDVLGDLY